MPVDIEFSGRPLRVLVACESSGEVRNAFRSMGCDAWSCDLLPSDDESPFHIQGDALPLIRSGLRNRPWDLVIAHPPCTHLASSGARWFAQKQADGTQQAGIALFEAFVEACDASNAAWCIENPVGIMSRLYRKPDQYVQPWMFGHPETKKTCFWIKGLPLLEGTQNVKAEMDKLPKNKKNRIHYMPPSPDRWKERSKTFKGIALAMASQWTPYLRSL